MQIFPVLLMSGLATNLPFTSLFLPNGSEATCNLQESYSLIKNSIHWCFWLCCIAILAMWLYVPFQILLPTSHRSPSAIPPQCPRRRGSPGHHFRSPYRKPTSRGVFEGHKWIPKSAPKMMHLGIFFPCDFSFWWTTWLKRTVLLRFYTPECNCIVFPCFAYPMSFGGILDTVVGVIPVGPWL